PVFSMHGLCMSMPQARDGIHAQPMHRKDRLCYIASHCWRSALAMIDFDRVHYAYPGGREVLTGLSFTLRAGETLALVGRSGIGKSTILKLINRLLLPAAGEVR